MATSLIIGIVVWVLGWIGTVVWFEDNPHNYDKLFGTLLVALFLWPIILLLTFITWLASYLIIQRKRYLG